MKMRSRWLLWITCCASVCSVGCAAAPSDDGAEPAQTQTAASAGELLARIELSETHYVEFREQQPGDLTVLEQFHADRDRGAVASDFDPSRQSVVAFYRQLAGRSAKPEALAALQEFEERALPFAPLAAADAEPAEAPELSRASLDKAAPPGWDFVNEFGWFSNNFCRIDTSNDRCFINLESFNDVQVANSVRGVLFNQDFDAFATMRINFDPCFDEPFFVFCTDPFKGLQKLSVGPRLVLGSSTWSNRNKYQVFASGVHIGVFVDYR
jgi:hypothetical protein